MPIERVPALLSVLSGRFASQPHAFTALVEAAETLGLVFDLADIDVIREAAEVRLAHYFRPQIAARIQSLKGDDDTVLILRPSALTAEPGFPPETSPFRHLGNFAGLVVEPPEAGM